MTKDRRFRTVAAVAAVAAALGARPSVADGPPGLQAGKPLPTFAVVAERLRFGRFVAMDGVVVQALRLDPAFQPGLAARVGLRPRAADGAAAPSIVVLELPLPAGEFHVRLTNRGDLPLEIPAGETLLSPGGPSRSVDRDLWIPSHASAFVPVVHSGAVPPGPYVSRGAGLTPVELALLRSGRWDERVRARNQRFGVDPARLNDAGAAYASPQLEALAEAVRRPLASLADGEWVVGVVVCDQRGPFFARIETDGARFREGWPALLSGIVLDTVLAQQERRRAWPEREADLRTEMRRVLQPLVATPGLSRPTFGRGVEHRWTTEAGVWNGLSLDGLPVALTMLRDPPVRIATPEPPPPGEPKDPGRGVIDRRARPTEAQERQNERRESNPMGPAGGPGPGTPGAPVGPGGTPVGGGAGGGAGGVPGPGAGPSGGSTPGATGGPPSGTGGAPSGTGGAPGNSGSGGGTSSGSGGASSGSGSGPGLSR